ncbi:MAG: metallophosphoesterase [Acidobacteria bacterium]|nr:metallophosphoesterase [Acidobacteriota bacterium]
MRVFAVSDLHTDFKENRLIIERLPARAFSRDILIVAGDIADRLEIIQDTLSMLRSKFRDIFYVPGNHELWVRSETYDSIEKLRKILEMCRRINVQTQPAKMDAIWIVPLFSWYDPQFDSSNDERDSDELEGWADYYFCKWPEWIGDLCHHFLDMNERNIRPLNGTVISFSHFLPRPDLLPSREHLKFKNLPKVSGCVSLDEQIRRLKSIIHVFGHSHINLDRIIDGIRYVHNPLLYPRERAANSFPLKMIWEARSHTS